MDICKSMGLMRFSYFKIQDIKHLDGEACKPGERDRFMQEHLKDIREIYRDKDGNLYLQSDKHGIGEKLSYELKIGFSFSVTGIARS